MIVEGLEQLHGEHKVIYQDLKPENIYFRDAKKTSLVLADFGISSIMKGYDKEVEVTASITDLYAAPELAHKGNRNEVMVTPAVDYFALGITMFELWLGEKPFKGVKATKRDYMIAEEQVDLPIDMPDDYATLIKGLIKPQRKDRWGNEQVRKWLKGEALAVEPKASKKASTAYDPLKFSNTESATTPKELAALMEKYPDIGKTCLYEGIIKDWLKKAGDLMLFNAIQNITSQYAKDKDAGLYSAILALDPERPFKSRGGKVCRTTEDIADTIMAESAYYMDDLKRPTANLYLYLAATESSQGKEAADVFCKYFKEYSPKRALALVYLKLQGDGGITIGKKHYQSPDELKKEKDSAQIDLIKKAVTEKDSTLLVWLSDIYGDNLESTDAFNKLSTPEQFFLLGLMPFLSFKELGGNSQDALRSLIDTCPGRSDLFEIYAVQGLPLKGQGCGYKRTPIDYAVYKFYQLSEKHGADTIRNMIRLLCKLGADVNEYSGDGTCPLINAYDAKNNDLVKLLLELGADASQYHKDIEQRTEIRRGITKFQNCISAGYYHTIGLKADGTVVAVGNNDNDQCNTSSWRDIVAVAAGASHTVGLKADGTMVAIGDKSYARCNIGSWQDIVAVTAGNAHTVGLKVDGTVIAVGKSDNAQCITGGWRDIVAVAAGNAHTVGLKADGTVVTVGNNDNAQCNTGGWQDIIAVFVGNLHTIGLKADGRVAAIGYNKDGQCNTGSWRDIVAIAAGAFHTVGLKADGTVVAVGDNVFGQCNTGSWRDIVAIAAGTSHTVGLKADGTMVAVGSNYDGQCNTGSWRYIGPVPEEKRIELKRHADQERIEQEHRKEQEHRAEEERIRQKRRMEEERLEQERREEQSKRWQEQGLCKYCGGKLSGLFSKKCKACGREN